MSELDASQPDQGPDSARHPTHLTRAAGDLPPNQAARRARTRKAELSPGKARLPYERIALVLQGGGALGSYQAGVYEGLDGAGIHPDWVAGISIGALNSAIIAGNAPRDRVARLREFWHTVSEPGIGMQTPAAVQSWFQMLGGDWRRALNGLEAMRGMMSGQRDFFYPRIPPLMPWVRVPPGGLGFYDSSALRGTLEKFADFDRINSREMRVSVSAVSLSTGNFKVFDNTRDRLRPEHFMASAALPPGLPPVEIDGDFYWDGGLVSNTPLFPILSERPRADTLVFQVDLYSARGRLPLDMIDVEARRKDIVYSSRTRMVTQYMEEIAHYRRLLREVVEAVPAAQQASNPWIQEARQVVTHKQYAVIHLILQRRPYEDATRDFEFSRLTMNEHWASGLSDFRRTLRHPSWFDLPPEDLEYVTHDIHREPAGLRRT